MGFLYKFPNHQYCGTVYTSLDYNRFFSGTFHYNAVFHPYSMYSCGFRFMGRKKGEIKVLGYKYMKKLTFSIHLFLWYLLYELRYILKTARRI